MSNDFNEPDLNDATDEVEETTSISPEEPTQEIPVIDEDTTAPENGSYEDDAVYEEPIDEVVPPFIPDQKEVSFEVSRVTTRAAEKDFNLADALALVRESSSTVADLLEYNSDLIARREKNEVELQRELDKKGIDLTDELGDAWFRTLVDALAGSSDPNETSRKATERPGSFWVQSLDNNGSILRGGAPKQKTPSNSNNVDEIVQYLTRRNGIGTTYDQPLWHSGIWIRLNTPPISAMAALQHDMSQVRVQLGMETKGMAFSNMAQTMMSMVVDFILQYVVDANVHYATASDLKPRISILDIPLILCGAAATMFPSGFPYAHPCIADVDKCNHITKEVLNLGALTWVDRVSLTRTQLKLMGQRFKKLTEDEIKLYQSEHVLGGDRMFWIGNIGLMLKVPTIQEYEESGKAWIENIITMTHGAFNEPPHGSNRSQYIDRLARATQSRQYSHWVKAIYDMEDGEEVLVSEDSEVIDKTLSSVLSESEQATEFYEAVSKYTDDSMLAMVAIPSFNCPACNTPVAEKFHERFSHLVPLDMLSVFFTLVNRKLR